MTDQKKDAEVTPVSLERMLLKKPEYNYDFKIHSPEENNDMLTKVCELMRAHCLPLDRSHDSAFFYNAVPDTKDDPDLRQKYLNQIVELNSKVHELGKKHKIDVATIVKDLVKRADTKFPFREGFPNSAYLFHAVYMLGMKEGRTPDQMFGVGLKAVENILTSPEYPEYLNTIARTGPTVPNILGTQLNYDKIM
jgi:hypothetical protein